MSFEEYLKGMIMKEIIIRKGYVKRDIKTFLKNMQENKLDNEIYEVSGNLDCIASLMLERKFCNSKCDQLELGNYLKQLGDRLIKYANEHVEQLEEDEEKSDVSKVKQEIRKELNDFIDEIFGGK